MSITEVTLYLIPIVVSIFFGIYALRIQGSYKRVRLQFYPLSVTNMLSTIKDDRLRNFTISELNKSPSVIVYLEMFGERNKNQAVLSHQLSIKNTGNLAAEKVTVKLIYDSRYSAEKYIDRSDYETLAKLESGVKRIHYETVENMCCSVFEIAMIPKGGTIEFIEYFLYESAFLHDERSLFESSISSDESSDLVAFPIYYDVSGKNVDETIVGTLYFLYSLESHVNNFIKKHDPTFIQLAKNYHPNYNRAYNERYWLSWPSKFWFRLLYKNRMVKFNVTLKNIQTVHKNELNANVAYEYFPDTTVTYSISDYSPIKCNPSFMVNN
ncbi:hypothetical protein WG904_12405 [Pedobacter sp. Du54]|uniref:hypothetical protein n=1 Tax=Pedobacter anseongensis TaxID=3133439 RepID=UPI003095F4BD